MRLRLADAAQVRQSFGEVLASCRRHDPRARIEGILVCRMESGVAELIVGATRDPVSLKRGETLGHILFDGPPG